jgi:glyoxalase family protein
MSDTPIAGTHHLTAIASGPQRNVDFYTEVLGLGLVKRTVNFDDPARITFTSVTRPGRQAAF